MAKKNGSEASVKKGPGKSGGPRKPGGLGKTVVVDRWVGVTEHWSVAPQEHDCPAAAA